LMYYIIAFSFDLDQVFNPVVMIGVILLVTAVSNLATSVPSAGGGIGTFEVAAVATLTLLGAESHVAGAYAIVLHTALLVPVTVLGLVYLWSDKISLMQLTRGGRMQSENLSYVPSNVSMKAKDI